MKRKYYTQMTLFLGLLVPGALLATALVTTHWAWFLATALYGIAFSLSDHLQRVSRAGGILPPCCPTDRHPVVLGGGWSWVLGRKACHPPNRTVCAGGRSSSTGRGWWHAGTTIRDVQASLACEGQTLCGHPSILTATLGGWIASGSHGSGGSLWTPTMGRLIVEDLDGVRRTLPSKSHYSDGMVILEVELFTVENVVCERRLAYLTCYDDVYTTLFEADTHLRAVFVDKYQALCITWVPLSPSEKNGSKSGTCVPLWLMTTLPARARRNMSVARWTRRMTLRAANAFGPTPPFLVATAFIALHTNFEVFVTHTSTPRLIATLCTRVRALFASGAVHGRMELRFGKRKQFLDFDLSRGAANDTDAIFHTLRDIYGTDVAMTLHKGKAQVRMPHGPVHRARPLTAPSPATSAAA